MQAAAVGLTDIEREEEEGEEASGCKRKRLA
jgi:hypothetical protein